MICLISRAERFSPNSIERDAHIFLSVVKALALRGQPVITLDEDRLPPQLPPAKAIFSMGRAAQTLNQLAEIEAQGTRVWNSAQALQRTTRSQLNTLANQANAGLRLLRNQRHLPTIAEEIGYPLWLKSDDAFTQCKEDVRFVRNANELIAGLQDLAARKVSSFVVCEHVEGDLIKFYGVAGTDFFHHLTVELRSDNQQGEAAFSKFGLEAHNSATQHTPFDSAALQRAANHLALQASIPIYGGDAIVRHDGSFAIIDFNDCPSFAPCAAEAAEAIAQLLTNETGR